MIRKHLNGLVVVLCLALAATLGAAVTDEYVPRTYTGPDGRTLPYRLLIPRNYDAGQKYPLVVFFHGAGERGNDNAAQLIHGASLFVRPEVREKFPCFVMAPQCPKDKQWVEMPWGGDSGTRPANPSEPMTLALGAMDALIKEFSIDADRIYVTGLSMGGYATWDCVTRYPDRFAAGVPICGGGDERTITPAVARVPVWAFHSEDDNVVKALRSRNMVEAMRKAGGKPIYFEYFGLGHFSWGKAYDEPELLPWMFAQRRGQADRHELKTKAPELPAVARFPDDSEFPGEGPLRKQEWFRNLWKQRRLMAWNDRQKDQGAVVFLGDSITQGWSTLARDFPNLKVANRGISGDLTRGVLYRLKEDVLDLNPSAVVLLIGTNDLEDGAAPELIAKNTKLILEAMKAHNPKMPVIVCRVMPSHASKNRPADKIQRINALVDEMVKGDEQFIRCDTWSIFADAGGNAKPEEFPDLLHPNAAGYARFAVALRPILMLLTARDMGRNAALGPALIALWPGVAPGETGDIGEERDTTKPDPNVTPDKYIVRLGNVSKPTITVFRPAPEKDTGAAVVVCPGGGYSILAYNHEGTEVCHWLNSIGVTGVLLKYRVPARKDRERYDAPLQDAQRAIALVRQNAKQWGIDPKRVGILGFSAGGHLSAVASNRFSSPTYPAVDDADRQSVRPDFSILIYPAYLTSKEDTTKLAPELQVSERTPPAFIVMTQDDPIKVENVYTYALALKANKVPCEVHTYATGGHGYGLRVTGNPVADWPALAERWMAAQGLLNRN